MDLRTLKYSISQRKSLHRHMFFKKFWEVALTSLSSCLVMIVLFIHWCFGISSCYNINKRPLIKIWLNLETSFGDFTYNHRRQMMAALPLREKIGYHLFELPEGGTANLLRKSKWDSQQTSNVWWFDSLLTVVYH